jgi:hypothetical protein
VLCDILFPRPLQSSDNELMFLNLVVIYKMHKNYQNVFISILCVFTLLFISISKVRNVEVIISDTDRYLFMLIGIQVG